MLKEVHIRESCRKLYLVLPNGRIYRIIRCGYPVADIMDYIEPAVPPGPPCVIEAVRQRTCFLWPLTRTRKRFKIHPEAELVYEELP